MMKEVIDDMEWGAVSRSVELLLQRSPARIALSASGIGGLLITLPVRAPERAAACHPCMRPCLGACGARMGAGQASSSAVRPPGGPAGRHAVRVPGGAAQLQAQAPQGGLCAPAPGQGRGHLRRHQGALHGRRRLDVAATQASSQGDGPSPEAAWRLRR